MCMLNASSAGQQAKRAVASLSPVSTAAVFGRLRQVCLPCVLVATPVDIHSSSACTHNLMCDRKY